MLLSDKSIDALVAAATPAWTVGDKARRASAREAVKAAAKDLELDPLKPPLPRFAASESLLRAAVRVLQLEKVEKALEASRARDSARRTHTAEVASLRDRRDQLVRLELVRRQDDLRAGKVPSPMPAKVREELAELRAELYPVEGVDVDRLIAYEPEHGVMEDALPPRGLPSVIFYAELVLERLRVLTENEHYQAPAARTVARAGAEARNLGQGHRYYGQDKLLATVRRVRSAVELADLHLLHERHALSVEELEHASSGRASVEQLEAIQ
jgi:hypothetical protein